jgi:hypothetical protein
MTRLLIRNEETISKIELRWTFGEQKDIYSYSFHTHQTGYDKQVRKCLLGVNSGTFDVF